jgi:hypothetical protein
MNSAPCNPSESSNSDGLAAAVQRRSVQSQSLPASRQIVSVSRRPEWIAVALLLLTVSGCAVLQASAKAPRHAPQEFSCGEKCPPPRP